MATAVKTPSAGMTGAVRSLQWTIQDLNGSVEHLGQSHDHLRRAQNMMAWTTAIFGALLLSGLVWIANDIFHLKDQLTDAGRRFDQTEAQLTALGTHIDNLNITIEQLGAEILASRNAPAPAGAAPAAGPAAGPDVSVLSTPSAALDQQAALGPPPEATVPDAAVQPQQQAALAPAPAAEIPVAAGQPVPAIAPSPPAPRDQLTPEELAQPSPVVVAAAPAAEPAAAAAGPAAVPVAAAAAGDLSDDQLLSYNDEQIDPADELLLLDENGNPK